MEKQWYDERMNSLMPWIHLRYANRLEARTSHLKIGPNVKPCTSPQCTSKFLSPQKSQTRIQFAIYMYR